MTLLPPPTLRSILVCGPFLLTLACGDGSESAGDGPTGSSGEQFTEQTGPGNSNPTENPPSGTTPAGSECAQNAQGLACSDEGFTVCGGALEGSWQLDTPCLEDDLDIEVAAIEDVEECLTSPARLETRVTAFTYDFTSNGNYSGIFRATQSLEVTMTAECADAFIALLAEVQIPVADISEFCELSQYIWAEEFPTVTCGVQGSSCICNDTLTYQETHSGHYEVGATTVTTYPDDPQVDVKTRVFTVVGDKLMLKADQDFDFYYIFGK